VPKALATGMAVGVAVEGPTAGMAETGMALAGTASMAAASVMLIGTPNTMVLLFACVNPLIGTPMLISGPAARGSLVEDTVNRRCL